MNQPDRRRPLTSRQKTGGIAAAVAAVVALIYGMTTNHLAVNQEKPVALASMMGPDFDTNLVVYKDHIDTQKVTYDKDGHAGLAKWNADVGPLPPWVIPAAPIMGWSPPYVSPIASGSRPLRYCIDEVRQFDQGHGTNIAGFTPDSIRRLWDNLFVGVSSSEDCSNPDLILGANAEVDCGSAGAYGCAAYNGRTTRVTFNGTLRANGTIDDHGIACSLWGHEILHALDLGHTGRYGGEGTAHGHTSSLGYYGSNGCPVDNPTGQPPVLDYTDGAGGFRYGLRLKGAPTPTPTPTPTRTPTATATPTATPTPAPGAWSAVIWFQGCPNPDVGPWCRRFVRDIPANQAGNVYAELNDPSGVQHGFVKLPTRPAGAAPAEPDTIATPTP